MLRFYVADSLTGRLVGELRPASWSITEPVAGPSTGTLTLAGPTSAAQAGRLRNLLQPRIRQVIVEDTDAPAGATPYLFGGPIPRRPEWNPAEAALTVPIVDWRYWFANAAVLRPGALGPGSTDYVAVEVEQCQMMTALMAAALAGTAGAPKMVVDGPPTSGVTRTGTIRQLNRTIGAELDDLRDRNGDGTCDWYTYMTRSGDGRTFTAHAAVAYPQRSSRATPLWLRIRGNPEQGLRGTRIVDYGWPEGVDQPTRVWAMGEGNPPDVVYAHDDLPDLTDGDELLWEQISGPLSGVILPGTAFEDAHALVSQTNGYAGQMSVTVTADQVPLAGLVAGDRVRLDVDDGWLVASEPGVRVSQRVMSGGSDQAVTQQLTLDLADPVPLPVDDPGVIGDDG